MAVQPNIPSSIQPGRSRLRSQRLGPGRLPPRRLLRLPRYQLPRLFPSLFRPLCPVLIPMP